MTTPNEPLDGQPVVEPLPPADAPAPGPVNRVHGAPSRLRVALIGGAALALVVGGFATSLAASSSTGGTTSSSLTALGSEGLGDGSIDLEHGRRGPHGFRTVTITAISGSDVTLGTEDGWRRTIAITDAIDLTKGGQDIALGDLKVGDRVRFAQTRNDDGTYTVTDLAVVVPTVRGTVSDVNASGFKVTTRDGTVWTVTVDGSTVYRYGTADGSLADVTNGTIAVVAGTSSGDDQLAATGVRVAPDRAAGTVASKTADSITITRRDGSTLVVHVDADTVFRVQGATDTATLADVAVDMRIGVSGRARADGSIDADAVIAGTGRGPGHGFGRGFGGPGPDAGDGALDTPAIELDPSGGEVAPIS